MTDLSPCPKCNSKNLKYSMLGGCSFVMCCDCSLKQDTGYINPEEALKCWNELPRRTDAYGLYIDHPCAEQLKSYKQEALKPWNELPPRTATYSVYVNFPSCEKLKSDKDPSESLTSVNLKGSFVSNDGTTEIEYFKNAIRKFQKENYDLGLRLIEKEKEISSLSRRRIDTLKLISEFMDVAQSLDWHDTSDYLKKISESV